MDASNLEVLKLSHRYVEILLEHFAKHPNHTLDTEERIQEAENSVFLSLPESSLPEGGFGLKSTHNHLWQLAGGFNAQSLSSSYYGFVIGGVTPAARIAETLVSLFDQSVHVHLPKESIATLIEDRASTMLLELLEYDPGQWPTRVFTTGATASNIVGLACGRQYVLQQRLKKLGQDVVGGESLLSTCRRAQVSDIHVLSNLPHSSIAKAANIVGIGSACIVDVARDNDLTRLDIEKVRSSLSAQNNAACIVVISCGEVNTGGFATKSYDELKALRDLCNKYGAWLHVDAAFGIFAKVLPKLPQYAEIRGGTKGLELADSITGDGHKLLNVPYDCGFFFSRHQGISSQIFGNPGAAYLKTNEGATIASPLNLGIENSRRFRALPVYATLISYGRDGYGAMVARMVELARRVSAFILECSHLELLPQGMHRGDMESVFNIVLFRALDDRLNECLVQKINESRRIYASGTKWDGRPATRFAIAKWDVDVERDYEVIKGILNELSSADATVQRSQVEPYPRLDRILKGESV